MEKNCFPERAAEMEPTILDKMSGKPRPPLLPKSRMAKLMARFGFCAASSLIWGGGGGGGLLFHFILSKIVGVGQHLKGATPDVRMESQ